MDCGINCIKYLLFIFNFVFTLCGLALLIIGILIHLSLKEATEVVEGNITFPTIGLIVIGAIIFTVAFFGCCGAIRESHCMIVTFAVFLLTILVIQLAVGIFAFVQLKGQEDKSVRESLTKTFNKYYSNENSGQTIDFFQSTFQCCGVDSYKDYQSKFGNDTIPWSCCTHAESDSKATCQGNMGSVFQHGCVSALVDFLKKSGKVLGGVAIGIAAVEFVGIVFALCLANSLKNAERRGYRV